MTIYRGFFYFVDDGIKELRNEIKNLGNNIDNFIKKTYGKRTRPLETDSDSGSSSDNSNSNQSNHSDNSNNKNSSRNKHRGTKRDLFPGTNKSLRVYICFIILAEIIITFYLAK